MNITWFDLPTEVRANVLEYLLEEPRLYIEATKPLTNTDVAAPPQQGHANATLSLQLRLSMAKGMLLPLLLVSKQFFDYEEAVHTLMRQACIILTTWPGSDRIAELIQGSRRLCVRKVRIGVPRGRGVMHGSNIRNSIDITSIHQTFPNARVLIDLQRFQTPGMVFLSHDSPLLALARHHFSLRHPTIVSYSSDCHARQRFSDDGSEEAAAKQDTPAIPEYGPIPLNADEEIACGRLNRNASTVIHDFFTGSIPSTVTPGRLFLHDSIIDGVTTLIADAQAHSVGITFLCRVTMATGLRCCMFTTGDAHFDHKDMCLRVPFGDVEVSIPQQTPDDFFNT